MATLYLTDLEKQAVDALDALGIKYIPQYPVRTGFVLDFRLDLPIGKVALEIDGPFHDNTKAKKRDHFRDHMLRAEGYEVVRISHLELQESSMRDLILRKVGHGMVCSGVACLGEAGQG